MDRHRVRVIEQRAPAKHRDVDLALHGAAVSRVILENLRESYWARETPTEFEVAESQRMDAMMLRELNTWGCK